MPVSYIRIVLNSFYLFIFYSEKFNLNLTFAFWSKRES